MVRFFLHFFTVCKFDCCVANISAFVAPRGSSASKYFTVIGIAICLSGFFGCIRWSEIDFFFTKDHSINSGLPGMPLVMPLILSSDWRRSASRRFFSSLSLSFGNYFFASVSVYMYHLFDCVMKFSLFFYVSWELCLVQWTLYSVDSLNCVDLA